MLPDDIRRHKARLPHWQAHHLEEPLRVLNRPLGMSVTDDGNALLGCVQVVRACERREDCVREIPVRHVGAHAGCQGFIRRTPRRELARDRQRRPLWDGRDRAQSSRRALGHRPPDCPSIVCVGSDVVAGDGSDTPNSMLVVDARARGLLDLIVKVVGARVARRGGWAAIAR